jgi:hypothetical protein
MNWDEMTRVQPRLAGRAHDRLIAPGVVLVATVRADGTPRVTPVEPFVMDGRLWLAMLHGSRKAADLRRDARVLLHSIVTSREGTEGEVKLRGTARAEHDRRVQERFAKAAGDALGWHAVVGRFHLFEVDIAHVATVRYHNPTGDQYVATWPPGREFVRRATSATSVGDPEEWSELLV